jgi:hypothetical protein
MNCCNFEKIPFNPDPPPEIIVSKLIKDSGFQIKVK